MLSLTLKKVSLKLEDNVERMKEKRSITSLIYKVMGYYGNEQEYSLPD